MNIKEVQQTQDIIDKLIEFSRDWEKEHSCCGYRANEYSDIEGNRIFIAIDDENIVGYLFGKPFQSKNMTSIMLENTPCFEVEELYVVPSYRSKGVGSALFEYVSSIVRKDVEYMVLSTATKNWRAIFHFYIEELDMNFWSARLYKRIR